MAAAAPSLKPEPDATVDPWARVENLPCQFTIDVPVSGFTVGDLVRLTRGKIVSTSWTVGQDVPLRINDELIAWSEFEVVQNHLAVRLTELA